MAIALFTAFLFSLLARRTALQNVTAAIAWAQVKIIDKKYVAFI